MIVTDSVLEDAGLLPVLRLGPSWGAKQEANMMQSSSGFLNRERYSIQSPILCVRNLHIFTEKRYDIKLLGSNTEGRWCSLYKLLYSEFPPHRR